MRNLSIIAHLIMMSLSYPLVVNNFYGPVLEFANFDLIDTEDLYEFLFAFEDDPYSD